MLVLDNTTDFFSVSIALKRRFINELGKHFSPEYKLENRVKIVGDLEKFRAGEDMALWNQSKGYSAKEFSLYWDDEFVCRFNTNHHIELVLHMFWVGLRDLYKNHKVGLLEPLPDPEDTLKEQLKKVDDMKLTTPTEKQAREVVKKLIKRKHGRKHARGA